MRTRRMCYELPPKRTPPIASLRVVRSSTCKLERTRAGKKKVGRGMEETRMCDLPADLVEHEILTRVSITSLRAVRSTCKLWDALSKERIFGKAAAARRHQFLGFITKDSKVCSVRVHLSCSSKDKEGEDKDLLDLSVKQVDLLDQVKISRLFSCDGLLLCVAKDHSCLLMWNPYLGQTQWIGLTTGFHIYDGYALGYDINRNHKILRFRESMYEIYEFSSNSWRVLKVTHDWNLGFLLGGMSLKGNSYFYARGYEDEHFLLCFDFTTERFGPRLPLPFHNDPYDTVALSSVKEEKLAVLYQKELNHESCNIVQIWVTTRIEPNYVSWSQFLRVEKPFALTALRVQFDSLFSGGSFFIDEEEKVAVVIDFNGYLPKYETSFYNTAFVIGEYGYLKSLRLRVPSVHFYRSPNFCSLLMCSSSYLPSLMQLSQPHIGQVPPLPPNLPRTAMFQNRLRTKTTGRRGTRG